MNTEGEGRIDKLQESLYSRDAAPERTDIRSTFTSREADVNDSWKHDDELAKGLARMEGVKPKDHFFNKIFYASLAFFAVAIAIAGFTFFGGFNSVSSKNVDITVQGQVAASAGEELVLEIKVINNNNVALENTKLLVEYPVGTREAGNITKELLRQQEDLGTVPVRGEVTRTVHAVLFGEKDSIKDISMSVDYKTKGSAATFSKQKTYQIAIKSAPVVMTVTYPKEVNSGQQIDFTLNITSNSNAIIKDLLVKAEYPFGWSFSGSNPEATYDDAVWKIGDLSPKEKRTIVIHGKIDGQNEEEKTFRFNSGIASENDDKVIGVDFLTNRETIAIKKPFVGLTLSMNNKQGNEFVTKIGERVDVKIMWQNNLPVTINDGAISVKLAGTALDRARVSATDGGFYRSIDNTIVWDKNTLSSLSQIAPGESGEAKFTIYSIPSTGSLISTGRNLDMSANVTVSGKRFSDGGPAEQVSSNTLGKVKIATEVGLNPRIVYSIGPFKNTGSVPAKAEKETTYTVIWDISNTFNDVSGAVVTAQLPQYVKWLGKISPQNEKISFDDDTNTITWNVGEVKAGTGFGNNPRGVAFQISFLPSLSQVGTSPVLVGPSRIVATDRFTSASVDLTKSTLTTKLGTDPVFNLGQEMVVK